MATHYFQDPFGAADYSAEGMPSLLSLSNLESLGRGSVAGLLGLPEDLRKMLVTKKMQQNMDFVAAQSGIPQVPYFLPSSEELKQRTPRMTAPTPQAGLLEDIGAFMSPVPAAAAVPLARGVGKAIKATEGMPVGMGIKDVGKGIASNTAQFTGFKNTTPHGKAKEVAAYLDKLNVPYTINKSKTTNSAYLEIQTGKGDFDYPMQFRFSDHSTDLPHQNRQIFTNPKPDPNFDLDMFKDGGHNTEFAISKINDLVAKVKLKTVSQQATYPKQAALDLAQQRAALPKSESGLGLPANNTPEMRYQAMKGVEGNFVHGSKNPDIEKFKTRKQIFEESANDPNRAIAENHYANERNAVFASSDPEFTTAFSQHGYTDVGQAPTSYPLRMIGGNKVFDFENPSHLDMLKQKYAEMFPVKTIGREGYVPSEESIRMHTINKRIENLPNDTNNWPAIESQDFQKAIRELGFDAFHVNERGTKNIGVYDPSSLRSPFAAYDPFRKDVATATAMGVALPDLLAAEPKEKRRQSAGLLSP